MIAAKIAMEKALGSAVIPWLRKQGFRGGLPHFRRLADASVDLLTVQFDKNGGAFVVEIARCPPEGVITHWGKVISPDKATAWDVHPTRRRRIQAEDGAGTEGWFRFDRHPPDQLATLLLAKLADPDLWRGLGPVGPADRLHLPV